MHSKLLGTILHASIFGDVHLQSPVQRHGTDLPATIRRFTEIQEATNSSLFMIDHFFLFHSSRARGALELDSVLWRLRN